MLTNIHDPRTAFAAPAPRPRRAHRRRVLLFVLLGVTLLSLTGVSFLSSGESVGFTITPIADATTPGSTLTGGKSVKVTPLAGAAFTIHEGKANKDVGRALYKIETRPTQSDRLYATFLWVDPQNANGALKNGWMEVGLFHQVGLPTAGECPATPPQPQYKITGIDELGDGVQKDICVAPSHDQAAVMGNEVLTQARGASNVRSSTAGKSYFYLLVALSNHGGNLPPGQQSQLGDLKFYLDANIR